MVAVGLCPSGLLFKTYIAARRYLNDSVYSNMPVENSCFGGNDYLSTNQVLICERVVQAQRNPSYRPIYDAGLLA